MSLNTELLKVGINVDIQRTDGRIHSAVISDVNVEEKSVMVEWVERGETKGKSIDFEALLSLNENLQRVSQSDEPPAKTNKSEKINFQQPSAREIPSSAKSRRSQAPPRTVATRERKVRQSENQPPLPSQAANETIAPTPLPSEAKKANAARRRTNCLKEVEKIKLKRDERRAAQQSVKDFVRQEYDTSHPNWEFLAMIREYQSSLEYRPLQESEQPDNHRISVCVRKRPLSKKEINKKEVDVNTVPNKSVVIVHEPKTKVDLTKYLENQQFQFDYTFDDTASNEMVYKFTAKPLVECIFDRGMATCFAYGQTGSGKTHTMGGAFSARGQQETTKGIYSLAAHDLFVLLNSRYKKLDLVAGASFFEIYSGKVFDLLNNKAKLRVLEDGKQQVNVVGLKEEPIKSVEQVVALIQHGNTIRTSGQTSANQHSSRSHAVFQLILRKRSTNKLHGMFSLIDLAGNERGADTMSSDRNTRMESAEINKSLLALKECIRALGRNGAHLPFRASKLTQVLRDSFIGDKSRTCMIAMISPGMNSCEHTLNTLRYAYRVKELGSGDGGEINDSAHMDVISPEYGAGCMSPQNSDLAMIKTINEEELPDDILDFHEAMNKMQELEEEVTDEHQNLMEDQTKWVAEDVKLYQMTQTVDCDMDAYAWNLKKLLERKMSKISTLQEKVNKLLQGMQTEESLCETMKSRKSAKK